MDKERQAQLREIQSIALDHAVAEMHKSDELGLDAQKERGDRSWLTGMASKSLAVAIRVEQFIMLSNREGAYHGTDEKEAEATDRLIRSARAEVRQILDKVSVGRPQRER